MLVSHVIHGGHDCDIQYQVKERTEKQLGFMHIR